MLILEAVHQSCKFFYTPIQYNMTSASDDECINASPKAKDTDGRAEVDGSSPRMVGPGWLQGFFRKLTDEQKHQTTTPQLQPLRRKSNETTAASTPAQSQTKQQQQLHRTNSTPDNTSAIRRSSIPTSICLDDELDEEGDDHNYGVNKGDELSVVSEVTLMTYSEEKASIIKEEFFKRLREQQRDLTLEEKQKLFLEIQQEKEETFKLLDALQKKRQRETDELLKIEENKAQDETPRNAINRRKDKYAQSKESWLTSSFTSTATRKHRNSIGNQDYSPQEQEALEEGEDEDIDISSLKHGIDDIIELKLIVANQQATIDTLSTKLHRAKTKNVEDQSRIQTLQDANCTLAKQLCQCQEMQDHQDKFNQDLREENERLKRQIQQLHNQHAMKRSNSTMTTVDSTASLSSI